MARPLGDPVTKAGGQPRFSGVTSLILTSKRSFWLPPWRIDSVQLGVGWSDEGGTSYDSTTVT